MKIAIGADNYGYQLKEAVKNFLLENNIEVEDYGITDPEGETPYYQIADTVATEIAAGQFQKGILICGTGMGMAIIANKHPGVYAAVCENPVAAERSRSINDSNVLTMGGMVTTPAAAKEIVNTWLKTEFTQGWEKPIVDWLHNSKKDIDRIEQDHFKK
ncbi:RpiB/LacA/LacB family sugar-phosphate isomerase [bacterium]|nr:RpiB/LacA/LacB family sugar-phosphate isomerase [bacterium]MCI0605606.1 RpiB/LacA/LacB family sugar-phosphate isomerase [bacterium]